MSRTALLIQGLDPPAPRAGTKLLCNRLRRHTRSRKPLPQGVELDFDVVAFATSL
jgi:hypothetical protein